MEEWVCQSVEKFMDMWTGLKDNIGTLHIFVAKAVIGKYSVITTGCIPVT